MTTHTLDTGAGRIEYWLERSSRRTLAILIGHEASVRVRAPRGLPHAEIERFVRERAFWIVRKRGEVAERVARRLPAPDAMELAEARRVLAERYAACWERFARPGEVRPELGVRVMRSRWGSLTGSGRVSLNAYLVRVSAASIDAVIYHELCHTRFRGHGPDFYRELPRYVPDWQARRAELRELL